MNKLTIKSPPLHAGQLEICQSDARFKFVLAGRRWGKTLVGCLLAGLYGMQRKNCWWIAPTYSIANEGWAAIKNIYGSIPGVELYKGERKIVFPGGGYVRIRSGQNPDTLRGSGLDLVILDEAAFLKKGLWYNVVRPALSDRLGHALLISTPNGTGWFKELYNNALTDPQWQTWTFPTSSNPHIAPSEIEAAASSLPDTVFRQEYLAIFVDDAGAYIKNIMPNAVATILNKKVPGHRYVVGVDWAFSPDSTVFSVCDVDTKEAVAMEYYTDVEYPDLVDKLIDLANRFMPEFCVIEENSVGKPQIQHLKKQTLANGNKLKILPFVTTATSKREIIDELALAFANNEIKIINEPRLIRELQVFQIEMTSAGKVRLGAPKDEHDDAVIALSLAWHGVKTKNLKWAPTIV